VFSNINLIFGIAAYQHKFCFAIQLSDKKSSAEHCPPITSGISQVKENGRFPEEVAWFVVIRRYALTLESQLLVFFTLNASSYLGHFGIET
jgi:hypothetical protein